jgi:hypothetical protein
MPADVLLEAMPYSSASRSIEVAAIVNSRAVSAVRREHVKPRSDAVFVGIRVNVSVRVAQVVFIAASNDTSNDAPGNRQDPAASDTTTAIVRFARGRHVKRLHVFD